MKAIPVVPVDLTLPPAARWAQLPKSLRRAGRTLATRASSELRDERLRRLAEWLMDAVTVGRNPYRSEIAALAEVLDIPRRQALVSNFAYEINQAACWGFDLWETHAPRVAELWSRIKSTHNAVLKSLRNGCFGCTSGAAYYPRLGMAHLRTLDWSLEGLGRHTVIWRCSGAPAGEYVSIGWPGYVGVLSGMAPGRFSATINQAFPFSAPTLQWAPSHLLRWVLEHCTSYRDALATLQGSPVCFPAFVLLVGVKPGEAAVVELTPRRNVVHRMRGQRPIAIANDYLTGEWRAKFDLTVKTLGPDQKGEQSEYRRNQMLRELNRRRPQTIERALAAIQADWLDNEATMQQMVFLPATGELLVIGQEDQEPVTVGGVGQST